MPKTYIDGVWIPKTYESAIKELLKQQVNFDTYKGRFENATKNISDEKKAEYKRIYEEAEKAIKILGPETEKLENIKKEKEKQKLEPKVRAKAKPKAKPKKEEQGDTTPSAATTPKPKAKPKAKAKPKQKEEQTEKSQPTPKPKRKSKQEEPNPYIGKSREELVKILDGLDIERMKVAHELEIAKEYVELYPGNDDLKKDLEEVQGRYDEIEKKMRQILESRNQKKPESEGKPKMIKVVKKHEAEIEEEKEKINEDNIGDELKEIQFEIKEIMKHMDGIYSKISNIILNTNS